MSFETGSPSIHSFLWEEEIPFKPNLIGKISYLIIQRIHSWLRITLTGLLFIEKFPFIYTSPVQQSKAYKTIHFL